MRMLLTLQQEVRNPDTGGGAALSWGDVAILWAEVRPFSGHEDMQGEKVTGRLTHKIRLRTHDAITTAMRFAAGNRVFNIRSVRNVEERGNWVEVLAEEGVAT